jgi:hypothetical protein
MAETFESLDDFSVALNQVKVLIDLANVHEKDNEKYATLIKSAVLLLVSKFESFLESIVDDYIFKINSNSENNDQLPLELKIHATSQLLNDSLLNQLRKGNKNTKKTLSTISSIWNEQKRQGDIIIDNKFNFGKHGEKAIKDLFNRIGFANIFDHLAIKCQNESMIEEETSIDMIGEINSIIGIRNNIIHQDATPELTHYRIIEVQNSLLMFANELNRFLINEITKICPQIEQDSNEVQKQIPLELIETDTVSF